jgi:integrase
VIADNRECLLVRVRVAFVERSTGEILHLSIFVKPEPGALVFPGVQDGPLRRSNFNKMSAWPYAVRSVGAEGLHVHDLRHTVSGAG